MRHWHRRKAPAAHVGPTGRAVGIDIDPGVIELARQLSRGGETPMEWHCPSALEMPLESDVFDLALCLQGLQFFPDRLKGFAEIRRVLKPSGRLVASFWGPLESNKGHHVVVQGLERLGVDAAPQSAPARSRIRKRFARRPRRLASQASSSEPRRASRSSVPYNCFWKA